MYMYDEITDLLIELIKCDQLLNFSSADRIYLFIFIKTASFLYHF